MIETHSIFYYGIRINSTNKYFNFSEGAGQLTAILPVGSFSITAFLVKLKTELDNIGALTYTVTLDRNTRKITISATGVFSILIATGTQRGTSPFSMMGFTGTIDLVGLSSYESDSVAGSEWAPQFKAQNYIAPEFQIEKIDSSVNQSASGALEIITFGDKKIIEMSFSFINDTIESVGVIKKDLTAVNSALLFLKDIILRGPLEFMPDINSRSTFYKVVLESSENNSLGTGYLLSEMDGLQRFYKTGILKFRIL